MLSLYTYRLPFRQPLITGAGAITERAGYLIHFSHNGYDSVTEASPLPGFSAETLEEIGIQLKGSKNEINSFFCSDFSTHQLKSFLSSLPQSASLQFAISYMGIELLFKRDPDQITKIFDRVPLPAIKVNAMIGSLTEKELIESIQRDYRTGIRTIKIKAPYPIDDLAASLLKANHLFPDISYRLDANRSWPADEFEASVLKLSNLPIEYIEEPFKFVDFNNLPDNIKNSTIPIAFDESISSIPVLENALKKLPEAVLIIKPTLLGNIFQFVETIVRYRSLLNDVVVTTTIESAIGRSMVTTVASLIGDPTRAHGLLTGYLFKKDLGKGPLTENGMIQTNAEFFKKHKINDFDPGLIQKFL
jgi:o-succinylbenzoate synthase